MQLTFSRNTTKKTNTKRKKTATNSLTSSLFNCFNKKESEMTFKELKEESVNTNSSLPMFCKNSKVLIESPE